MSFHGVSPCLLAQCISIVVCGGVRRKLKRGKAGISDVNSLFTVGDQQWSKKTAPQGRAKHAVVTPQFIFDQIR